MTQAGTVSMGGEAHTIIGGLSSGPLIGGQIGRVLGGRYQLDQCIGAGGMGEIYRAKRLHIGDTVAVKVLRPDVVDNDISRQRFYREARAAAMLHHPNAVVIHDFGEDTDRTAYIVMELLIGCSLRQLLIDQGPLNPARAFGIIRQACAALEAGHRNGIIHRDIKPDNIFLLDSHDGVDHVKILDFGIAKLRDKAAETASLEQSLTNIGTVIGTPHYMSPEQCQGEEADARSDIYSLGIVLYELLTGVAPFLAKTATGVAIKHVTEQPRPPREHNRNISPAVERVVLRALSKNPNARPQTALELAREFEAMLADQSSGASGASGASGKKAAGETSPPLADPVPFAGTTEQQAATTDGRALETAVQRRGPNPAGPGAAWRGQREQSGSPSSKEPGAQRMAGGAGVAGGAGLAAMAESAGKSGASGKSRSRVPLYLGLIILFLAASAVVAWQIRLRARQAAENALTASVVTGPSPEIAAGASPTPSPVAVEPPKGMVYVPGGELQIGRDTGGDENERPAHLVKINPFFIDRTEVTAEQYQKFIEATQHQPPPSWQGNHFPEGLDKFPVTDVTWEDAKVYALWVGKRLPTEEEWEFAARGTDGRTYPWGNQWTPNLANISTSETEKRQLAPVGKFPNGSSPFGVLDLAGNAWEWTSSDYQAYPGGKISSPAGYGNLKVIRGGSYESTPEYATTTLRRGRPATRKDWPDNAIADYSQTGFRCVQDVKTQ